MQRISGIGSFVATETAEDRREWRAGVAAAAVILGGAFACWVVFSAPVRVSDLTDTMVPAADASSIFAFGARENASVAAEFQAGAVTPLGIMRPVAEDTTPLAQGDIVKVQRKLKSLGFDPGKADGAAGPHTLTALNAYRKSLGLAPVTTVDRQAVAPLLP